MSSVEALKSTFTCIFVFFQRGTMWLWRCSFNIYHIHKVMIQTQKYFSSIAE